MALTARYLADKSALARFSVRAVEDRLRPLLEEGLLATCAVIDLEVLYSARNIEDYEAVLAERRSLDNVPITPEVMATSIETQHRLAHTGRHRVPIPDLIIAAAAEAGGLVLIHYDADFELISGVSALRHEWVVPRGTI